jgi:hypothetical protein
MKAFLWAFIPAAVTLVICRSFGADLAQPGFGLGMAICFAAVTGAIGFAFYKAEIE